MSGRSTTAVAFLFFTICCCWAVASPIGSSPDDEYHLQRIWCASDDITLCAEASPGVTLLPPGIVGSACYAFNPALPATCQDEFFESAEDFVASGLVIGDFYPSGYAKVLSLFASTNVDRAVLSMRIFNSALLAIGALGVSLSLDSSLRRSLWMSLSFSLLPLGFFIVPSVNPSSWVFSSSVLGFFSLYALSASSTRRQAAIHGISFFFFVVVGLLARSDSVLWIVFSILVVGFLRISRQPFTKLKARLASLDKWRSGSMIALFLATLIAFFLIFWSTAGNQITFLSQERNRNYWVPSLLQNFSELPSLVLGSNGFGPLGWMDTPMPPMFAVLWVLVAGLLLAKFQDSSLTREKIALALGWIGLCLLVLAALARLGLIVGEIYQPRYFTPGVMICISLMCIPLSRNLRIVLTRSHRFTLVGSLTVAMFFAIHTNMLRYTNGLVPKALNPTPLWWRDGFPPPISVAVITTGMYATFLTMIWRIPKLDDSRKILIP